MRVLFPTHPFEPSGVDPDFADQHRAAIESGLEVGLIDYEALADGRITAALRKTSASTRQLVPDWAITSSISVS